MTTHLLIGATNSGCGKTTFSIGLLRSLRRRALKVQPFKCGPDYIDKHYHALASGYESVNLDSWMASKTHLQEIYNRYGESADICLTEGVMGLFDGYDKAAGSSAEIAMLLHIPVVLLINAHSMAYSAAPIIYGFRHFCPQLKVAGVVFNQTGSLGHNEYLLDACRDAGVECFGCLPRIKNIEIPSRHLGLTLKQNIKIEQLIDNIADEIEQHIDIERLLSCCTAESPKIKVNTTYSHTTNGNLQIAVARDAAFNFTYRENIDRLKELGKIIYFSPMNDEKLPSADLVYLPGGYPEFFLEKLSCNTEMQTSIRQYIENNGRVLAECGGMMYLCRSIIGMDGKKYPMTGIFQQDASMQQMHLHLGYRRFDYHDTTWRGHEFHYSSILQNDIVHAAELTQYNAKGSPADTTFFRYKNVVSSYTHLYWGENNILQLFD
jgi:cobyrinic acid a,c-diamide synthase